jgi:hypothetical protein
MTWNGSDTVRARAQVQYITYWDPVIVLLSNPLGFRFTLLCWLRDIRVWSSKVTGQTISTEVEDGVQVTDR